MDVSVRLDEIEYKQKMSFQMFTKLNKEIRKIQNFIKKYCSDPDAPNACWPDYRGGFRKRKSRKKRRKKKHKTRKRKKSRHRR
tara:strand:+ start:16116 stop:16364 length:249 start_codon:yes stop_codon:yes gene_type:complete